MLSEKSSLAPLLSVPIGPYRIDPESAGSTDSLHLSVIVPTYRESKNIAEMVRRLTELLDGAFPRQYEIIVVDDNSPDRTWELAHQLTADYPRLRVMRREHERGLSSAVIRGWQAARGDILAVIDADLQHPPEVTLDLCKVTFHAARSSSAWLSCRGSWAG
jgi:dolichol-phosphate mannosyltransferase